MSEQHFSGPVAVAVSGGADSLHTLVTLREQGFEPFALHGLFLPEEADGGQKTSVAEGLSSLCGSLGIALHCVDLRAAFLEQVIRPFVESYARGDTPNPCALCNARIKFGLLQDAAFSLGAAALATGHYARLLHDPPESRLNGWQRGQGRRKGAGPEHAGQVFPALLQGADPAKDQSYFLALVPLARLERAMFPLERMLKKDVLARLAERGLTPPQPGESQEVCFIPGDAYRDFVPIMAKQFGIALPGPGPMLLRDGYRVGTHKGLWRYTEGQRKGLGVGWKEPLHVLAKETEDNVLRLGAKAELRVEGCRCDAANILLPREYWPERVFVKTRYRERPKAARVTLIPAQGDVAPGLAVRFEEPENAVAPGQVAAVYVPYQGYSEGEGKPLRLAAGGVICGLL